MYGEDAFDGDDIGGVVAVVEGEMKILGHSRKGHTEYAQKQAEGASEHSLASQKCVQRALEHGGALQKCAKRTKIC